MAGIKDKIRRATLAEATVSLCLNGALVAEFEQHERELQAAKRNASDTLDGNAAVVEIAERMEALRERMTEDTEVFRLRALPRNRWRELVDQHQPRRGEDGALDKRDAAIGVDVSTMFPALVRASVVSPVLDAEDWSALLGDESTDGVLTDAQFDALSGAAWRLNRSEVDIPFSFTASRILSSERE